MAERKDKRKVVGQLDPWEDNFETENLEPSLTKQEFVEESDINVITERYLRTGVAVQMPSPAKFGDFTALDFQKMQNALADVGQQFDALPARIRNRFQNSPYQLLRFLENEDNREEAIKLGLVEEKKTVEQQKMPLGGNPAANPGAAVAAATGPAAQPPTP